MIQVLNAKLDAGAKRLTAPRSIGEIIAQMKKDHVEPFGEGYHKWLAQQQGKEVQS